jgi:hypothetical protein
MEYRIENVRGYGFWARLGDGFIGRLLNVDGSIRGYGVFSERYMVNPVGEVAEASKLIEEFEVNNQTRRFVVFGGVESRPYAVKKAEDTDG